MVLVCLKRETSEKPHIFNYLKFASWKHLILDLLLDNCRLLRGLTKDFEVTQNNVGFKHVLLFKHVQELLANNA